MTGTKTLGSICLAAAIVCRAALEVSGMQGPVQPVSTSASDEHERRAGERLTVRFCSDCHDVATMTTKRRTASEWEETVEIMASRAGEATPADVAAISRYLTRSRGIIAVNSATAAEFVAVLGLSHEVANAVVAYRTAHDKIRDLDALLEIPGLEKSTLERDAQALRFE